MDDMTYIEDEEQGPTQYSSVVPIRQEVQQFFYSPRVITDVAACSSKEVSSVTRSALVVCFECSRRLSLHILYGEPMLYPKAIQFWRA